MSIQDTVNTKDNKNQKNGGQILFGFGIGCLTPFILLALFVIWVCNLPVNERDKARETLSQLNQAQQEYFLKNNRFASQISELQPDFKSKTESYDYDMSVINPQKSVKITAVAKNTDLASFTSGVFAVNIEENNQTVFVTKLCGKEAVDDDNYFIPPAIPILVGINAKCPPGSFDASNSSYQEYD